MGDLYKCIFSEVTTPLSGDHVLQSFIEMHTVSCLVSHRCYLIGWHSRQGGGVIKGDLYKCNFSEVARPTTVVCRCLPCVAYSIPSSNIQVSSHSLGWQSEHYGRYFGFQRLAQMQLWFSYQMQLLRGRDSTVV